MQLLPSGFALPPLPYLVGLLAALAATGAALHRTRPPVTEGTVAALAPWMAAGGGLYALFQTGAVPAAPVAASATNRPTRYGSGGSANPEGSSCTAGVPPGPAENVAVPAGRRC